MKKSLILFSAVIGLAAFVFAAEQATSPSATTEHRVVNPADLKWNDTPPGLPPGGKMALLNGDPAQAGAFTVRLKAPAGYTVKPHTHPTAERLTVISGRFKIGMGEKFDEAAMQKMAPGSYIVLPANMAHYAKGAT